MSTYELNWPKSVAKRNESDCQCVCVCERERERKMGPKTNKITPGQTFYPKLSHCNDIYTISWASAESLSIAVNAEGCTMPMHLSFAPPCHFFPLFGWLVKWCFFYYFFSLRTCVALYSHCTLRTNDIVCPEGKTAIFQMKNEMFTICNGDNKTQAKMYHIKVLKWAHRDK